MRKRFLCHMRPNKGTDQPAHPRSLISAFVVRCLDSVMSLVSVTKISSLMLASVAEQASLSLTWSKTPEDEAQEIYSISCCTWKKTSWHKWHKWAPSRENLSLCVWGGGGGGGRGFRPGKTQIDRGLKFWIKKLQVLYYLMSEQQRCWSDCADAQAEVHLCCLHIA